MYQVTTVRDYGMYRIIGPTKLPLAVEGKDRAVEFTHNGFRFPIGRYSVLSLGNPIGFNTTLNPQGPLVRVSSNCQWSFYFDSQLCDCRWQLETAKRRIVQENGLLIFAHDQNGKGLPIEDHWLVYAEGQHAEPPLELVVDAYRHLGFEEDSRQYRDIAAILKHYLTRPKRRIRLLSNSPRKKEALDREGIETTLEPLEQPIHDRLRPEYRAKREKLEHLLKGEF